MPDVNIDSIKSSVYDKEINDWGGYLFAMPELDIPFVNEPITKIYHNFGRITIENVKPYREKVSLSVVEAYQLRDFLIENLDDITSVMAESGRFDKNVCKALSKFLKVYYEDHVKKLKDKIKELEEKLSKESSEVSE